MAYELGIDLGTTYTAAAIHRNGRAEVCSLGSRSAAIPSVVLLRDDETVLTGEAAVRRALSEPGRVAREFKRRLGDTTPILVGGSPYSAEALMSRLLRSVVDEVRTREGDGLARIAVSHPANWGAYKIDLLHQAVRLADLDPEVVVFTTEPAAAATFYAHQERVEPGEIVAVYDLGGGTFDAAILRADSGGFEILGRPEGIERLGGIDFDAAVFSHVVGALGGLFDELDPDDPVTQNAVSRLRQECVDAKEALSSDTDAVIPVLLPNVQTEVRLTRAEFEGVIRPSLADSIAAMRRAMRSAEIEAEDVSKVLLVGGSSRIPLIAQLVSAELGRPVAVDAHPKHAISMGAAYVAAGASGVGDEPMPAAAEPAPPPPPVVAVPPTSESVPVGSSPAAPSADAALVSSGRSRVPLFVGLGVLAAVVIGVAAFALTGGSDDDVAAGPDTTAPAVTETTNDDASAVTDPPTTEPTNTEPTNTEPPVTDPARPVAAVRADVEVAIASLELLPGRADVSVEGAAAPGGAAVTLAGVVDDDAVRADVVVAATSVDGVTSVFDELAIRPPDERCSDEVRDRERWVCVVTATFDGETLRSEYVSDFAGEEPRIDGGFHYHVFGSQIEIADGGVPGGGPWLVWEDEVLEIDPVAVFGPVGVPEKLCMRIADAQHRIDDDSGSCRPIERVGAALQN